MSYLGLDLDIGKVVKSHLEEDAAHLTRVAARLTIFHNFHCFIPGWILSMGNSSFTYVIDLDDVIIMFLLNLG